MDEIITQKRCTKCGEIKSLDEFHKDKKRPDRHSYICKYCDGLKTKKYYQEHSAHVLDRQKDFRKNNHEEYSRQRKEWVNKNRKSVYESIRKWTDRNIEKVKAQQKRWRDNNKERTAITVKKWANENKDRRALTAEKRRIAKAESGGTILASEWRALKEFYGNKCLCCGRTDMTLTLDHVVPISKGGTHTIDNAQPLCGSCNSSKHTKIIDYRPK